jgi:tetratricopeptide (TPR) repeat protein
MTKYLAIPSLAAALLSTSAVANPVDNYAASAIKSADYAQAESALRQHLGRAPADQPALLNLAYVYRHTARHREANALYSRVLNRGDVLVTKADGTPVSAHYVARAGLTGTVSIASR